MADAKPAKEPAAAAAGKEPAPAAAATKSAGEKKKTPGSQAEDDKRAHKKSRWNLDLCKNRARRFKTREEWKKGAPASYRAAVAKGWESDCVTAQQERWKGEKPAATPAARTRTPTKKSA